MNVVCKLQPNLHNYSLLRILLSLNIFFANFLVTATDNIEALIFYVSTSVE